MTVVLWVLRNWRFVLLFGVVATLGVFRIRIGALNRSLEKARDRAADLEGYKNTREKMDDVDQAIGDDPADAREWLHKRPPDER